MTRPKPSRQPVSSFGPELMEILIQGSQRRIEIPCDSMKQMKHLQLRIHTLRGAMQKERHPNYAMATRARTACTWDHEAHPGRFPSDATKCVLVVAPHDSQFDAVLKRAGITVSDAAKDVLNDLAAPDIPADPSISPTPPAVDTPSPIEHRPNPYKDFTS